MASAFSDRCSASTPINKNQRKNRKEICQYLCGINPQSYTTSVPMAEFRAALSTVRSVLPGPDNIINSMLCHLPEPALLSPLNIFNHVWNNHHFPDQWRDKISILILKPGKTGSSCSEFRPISLTSSVGNIFEKIVNARLVSYLEVNEILCNGQCGFPQGRSTLDRLASLGASVREGFFTEILHRLNFYVEPAYDLTWRHGILSS